MYFDNCKDLNELKAAYKRLALEYHPDRGGDTKTMQAINAEYDRVFDRLKRAQNREAERPNSETRKTTETPEKYRNVIERLIRIQDITIELCGSWLWISGNTYEHRAELKSCGCMFSRSKKRWYWRHVEDGSHWSRGKYTMGEIRAKYGSIILETEEKKECAKIAG